MTHESQESFTLVLNVDSIDRYAAARSLFHEEDHPRGQPENAGQFAPKGGGGATASKPAASKQPAEHAAPSKQLALTEAFEAALSPSYSGPVWQPKLFDAEPSGQKTMFDAGIEKGYGKKKPAAAKQQSLLGPSLVEKIEAELQKQAEASRPMQGQKAMFSRLAAARDDYAKHKPAAGQKSFGGEHWITIGGAPDGSGAKHAGGTPVKVDGSGKIVAGPAALKAKGVTHVGGSSDVATQKRPAASAKPQPTAAKPQLRQPQSQEQPQAQPQPQELDPATDYKQNGTRSKAFKAWFGVWENDPANSSKVVAANGEPKETAPISGEASKVMRDGKPVTVYHGTASGGFDEFDKSKIADPEGLLYGPGFYFTEDQGLASEYTKKGDKKVDWALVDNLADTQENREMIASALDGKLRKMIETRKSIFGEESYKSQREEGRFYVEVRAETAIKKLRDWKPILTAMAPLLRDYGFGKTEMEKWGLSFPDSMRKKDFAEVKQVYLNIRKPFDGDGGIDLSDLPGDISEKIFGWRKPYAESIRAKQIESGEKADSLRKKSRYFWASMK